MVPYWSSIGTNVHCYMQVLGEAKHNWHRGATKRGCTPGLAGAPSPPRTWFIAANKQALTHLYSRVFIAFLFIS